MRLESKFGIILRKYRTKRGLTQEELAHKSGLNRTFISFLELGKRKPTIVTIFSLAEVLEVKPSLLVQEVEEFEKNT